jgi:hypothetical protein
MKGSSDWHDSSELLCGAPRKNKMGL